MRSCLIASTHSSLHLHLSLSGMRIIQLKHILSPTILWGHESRWVGGWAQPFGPMQPFRPEAYMLLDEKGFSVAKVCGAASCPDGKAFSPNESIASCWPSPSLDIEMFMVLEMLPWVLVTITRSSRWRSPIEWPLTTGCVVSVGTPDTKELRYC